MAKISSLAKIRDMHDNEKQVAQRAYAESQETFEKIARELYSLLKKKKWQKVPLKMRFKHLHLLKK